MVAKRRYTPTRRKAVFNTRTRLGKGSLIKYTTGARAGQGLWSFGMFPKMTARSQGRLRWGGAMDWLHPRKR